MDSPKLSEILGVFISKDQAISELLERANYRDKNGRLTQYMKPTDEYESFETLRKIVEEEMELCDVDIYRIVTMPCITPPSTIIIPRTRDSFSQILTIGC